MLPAFFISSANLFPAGAFKEQIGREVLFMQTRAFPAVALGVVGAALIIPFATYGAGNLLLSIGG